jgi:SAM-dependent methyltransferase
MPTTGRDTSFQGAMPLVYERCLVPLIFKPYAEEMADRVLASAPGRVLEIAAGTGVMTRALSSRLPAETTLVATDLSGPMLQVAQAQGTARPVTWQQADAMELPFADGRFDAVVCQFGAMFFPDKARAFAQARRVLAPGGLLLFSVWDRIEDNDFPLVVTQAVAALFPDDPPTFLARVPHGYHDVAAIRRDLAAGGFEAAAMVETVSMRSAADTPALPAVAFCQGTPLRNEIEARGGASLTEATAAATKAIAARFGHGAIDGQIKAHLVTVVKESGALQ